MSNTPSAPKGMLVAYWLTTIMGPFSFVVGGTLGLTGGEQLTEMMNHLGYPLWLPRILGSFELAGALVAVLPGLPLLKEWAYAGFFILLTGASASHLLAGDPVFAASPFQAAPPMFFLAMVMVSWALRPASRRLPGTGFFPWQQA